jgi:CarD family transcriptional regulator
MLGGVKKMYEVGNLLIYDTTGVCRVEAIGTPAGIPVQDKTRQYYTLAPVFGKGTIYIPVDTKVFMRPLITEEEAEELIRKMPDIQADVCESHNLKVIEDHYKASLKTHRCEDLVCLIRTVYQKRKKMERNGKKAGRTDQMYMKIAQTLLHEELSVVLGIPIDEVEGYITARMDSK